MKTINELMEWCITNSVRVSIEPGMVDASPAVKIQFDDMIDNKRWVTALDTVMFREVRDDIDIVGFVIREAEHKLELTKRRYRTRQRREKLIIIHRTRYSDCIEDSRWIIGQLVKRFGASVIERRPNDSSIYIYGIEIMFYHGDISKCDGLEPDYYITKDASVANYLAYRAARRNGKRLQSLEDVIRVVEEVISDDRK